MVIVRFARSQQRTLLVAAVGLAAAGAFSAGVWLGTQPLPGAGSAREALAAEARPIALLGSNRATTAAKDSIELIPTRSLVGAGRGPASGGPSASDTPPVPGPSDPQDPTPAPTPDPTGPTPIPVPTEPVVDAIEDALNGVIGTLPVSVPLQAPAPSLTTVVVDSVSTVTGSLPLP